jgi:hypothetical protein
MIKMCRRTALAAAFFLLPLVFPQAEDADSLGDALSRPGAAVDEEGDADDFDPDTFEDDYDGPDISVMYDKRSEIDYIIVEDAESYTEYHYIDRIKYSDLLFVLTDLFKRINNEGYTWSAAPETAYGGFPEVVLMYKRDKVQNMAYGIVQFPDFKISVEGAAVQDNVHTYNVADPQQMLNMIILFTRTLASVSATLNVESINAYMLRYFKPQE